MKINNNNIRKMLKTYNTQPKDNKINKADRLKKRDKIALSTKGKDYQMAMEAIKNVPDIRQDKVDEIKKKVNSGTYNIDAEEIAEKMINHIDIGI